MILKIKYTQEIYLEGIKELMNKMKNIIRILRKCVSRISPVFSNKIMYRVRMHKKLNIKNPKTFNDKINWLKLNNYQNNELVIKCTDKYLVREYIREKGYDYLLNDLYFSCNSVDEIKWENLPQKFVLKCNHGAGYNILCNDKNVFDYKAAKVKLNRWINEDFGLVSVEPHYSKIKRKIICEKFLEDEIKDYKFFVLIGNH